MDKTLAERLRGQARFYDGMSEDYHVGNLLIEAADALDRISPPDAEELPFDRDTLGRMVREAWVRWAKTQPAPKPSWLVAYDDLAEPDKEADRQIGEAIAKWTMIGSAARAHSPAADRITPPDAGVELVRYGVTDYQFATPVMEPREAGPWVRYEDANAALAAEKARADDAEAKLLKSVQVNVIAIREKNAAEARCDTLAGALARSEDYVNRLKTRIAHYERALATIPAKPETQP